MDFVNQSLTSFHSGTFGQKMAASVRDLVDKYKKFVIKHPDKVGHAETLIQVASYLSPGSSDVASILSELLSTASSLVTLLNDAILRKAAHLPQAVPAAEGQLRMWLSVLDCVEVFVEITAIGLGGDTIRWLFVFLINIIKASLRLLLLFKHKSGLFISPAVPSLKRDRDLKTKLAQHAECMPEATRELLASLEAKQMEKPEAGTYTLTSSGRVVRSLSATPPLSQRTWKLPQGGTTSKSEDLTEGPTPLTGRQKLAESLTILRPLVHLCSLYKFGQVSWKPWLLAAGVDLSSLCLMGEPERFNPEERGELRRRTYMMLLYLLRSPFYDRFSRARIVLLLGLLSNTVPGARMVVGPLLDYLPWWQKIYFYVWMS